MAIADKLVLLRKRKRIYQKELAAYLKISIGAVSNYEKGVHEPDLKTLCNLADFYGVSTDYLLERNNIPLPMDTKVSKRTEDLGEMFLELTRLSGTSLENIRQLGMFLRDNEISSDQ